jgi:hypothetical protein
MEPYICVSPT